MRFYSRYSYKLLLLSIFIILVILLLINFTYDKPFSEEDPFIVDLATVLQTEKFHKKITLSSSESVEILPDILVNITNFKYVISNKRCAKYDKEILGIIIVTSYVGHDHLRYAHRQAISQIKLAEMGFIRVFLIAQIADKEKYIKQTQIEDENRKFGDLLQGNFYEAYKNLTYKHIMGLKWAAVECFKAKFIVKVDDDIVYDIFQLKSYLESLELLGYEKYFLAGYILDSKIPIRISANKWFVSQEEFSGNSYPDYLSGWLYITNPATARQLVSESQKQRFFWIDDTWITGILRDRLQIPLIKLNSWFSANAEFIDCCVRDLKDFSYECEYYVGPNGGDANLIIEFLHNVEKCYFDECSKRSPEKSLKQTCVAKAKNLVQDHGDALIRRVKLR